ncbi:MAG: hypothetical protein OXN17_03030 [Candidatus Poribacteria bacterium]|nr:hypothetical protein [Candidatus Poribacteria bacterium]MDE0503395.1 hypothetical protein [Candidatus Poribacteria bacterium]
MLGEEQYQAYRNRIEELRCFGELDGISVNQASEKDFWSFFGATPFVLTAETVLLDNGNLRVIRDDEDGNHVRLQFLGNGRLHYVIFRRRKRSSHVSRVAGRDTFNGVRRRLRLFELEPLLQA